MAYHAPQFDSQLGVGGLHKVHPKVGPRPRETILPPDLFERYSNMAFWHTLRELQGLPHRQPAGGGQRRLKTANRGNA